MTVVLQDATATGTTYDSSFTITYSYGADVTNQNYESTGIELEGSTSKYVITLKIKLNDNAEYDTVGDKDIKVVISLNKKAS